MLTMSSSSSTSSGIATSASQGTVSLMPASPNAEFCDESSSKLTAYLHRLAGYSETELDSVVKEHSYARPWNWKPENIYVKPVKKIFFSKLTEPTCGQENTKNFVKVEESHSEELLLPYDLTRMRHQMDEFQRLANYARPEDNCCDWEEKIEKISWLPIHHRIFSKVMRILTSERLARLAKVNCPKEPIIRRTSIDTAARRFREILAFTGWNLKTTQWLHNLLFEHLPQEYLAIYLDILQTLRLKIPQLIDRMMSVQPSINGKAGSITWDALATLLKRSWDPLATYLNSNRPKKLPGNPIMIVAPSGISSSLSSRQHKWISQLGNLAMIVNVHMHLGLAANRMTMITCMDQLVQATRAKIQDVRGDYPGRPIIIIGFNSGATLACQVAQIEHVSAVICLGFPFMTVEGKRGSPDDTLMDMRCPVMFVIGEHASLVRPDDLEDMREKMLVQTNLVIVGTADDHLRISTAKKISEGITQAMVDRCILDEVGDFLASILLQPHPLPLRPVTFAAFENVRNTKKEPRKRKNSTSSSVESESNSPNVKKSRPGTPILSPIVSPMSNSALTSIGPRPITATATPSNLMTFGAAGPAFHAAAQVPMQKKKNKVPSSENYNFSGNIIASRQSSQQTTSSDNGGITLNIGSLASLAPIGPIRLTPTGTGQIFGTSVTVTTTAVFNASTTTTTANPASRGSIHSQSPMSLTKVPKIVQTKSAQTSMSRVKTALSMMGKLPKGTSAELKSLSAAPTISAPQNKIIGNTDMRGSLTALLQPGKSTLGVVGTNSTAGRSLPATSTSGLLTSTIGSNVMASTLTTTVAGSKVMDSMIIGGKVDDPTKINSKNHLLDCNPGPPLYSPMLLPITNKTPITILPLSGHRVAQKNATKSVPKITMNSHSGLKSQCGKMQSLSITKKNVVNDIDEDLGNILDIPIIFAKDGDNLGIIENIPNAPAQTHIPNSLMEPVEKAVKRLGSTTKVVLISNKQDKSKIMNQTGQTCVRPSGHNQGAAHKFLLQSRSQNPTPVSIGTNCQGLPMQTLPRANPPTIKYTKIILAKRNSDLPNVSNNSNKNEQVILTKSTLKGSNALTNDKNGQRYVPQLSMKIPTSSVHGNPDSLEIEDAIKTNIIERKLSSIPEIDLTSPIKNQIEKESLETINVYEDLAEQDSSCASIERDTLE